MLPRSSEHRPSLPLPNPRRLPASLWRPSARRFQAQSKAWDYPDPGQVRKVRQNGGVCLGGRSYFISRAFIGEHVQLQVLNHRVAVWFCRTLVREFDLHAGTSHPVDPATLQRARTQGF